MLVAMTLAAGGCDITEGCDICTTSALVFGTVSDDEGLPLVGVGVQVFAYRDGCADEFSSAGTGDAIRTDSQGRYRALPLSVFEPFTAQCVVVAVNPLEEGDWPVVSDTVDVSLEFRQNVSGTVQDSVRVDVVVLP